MIKHSKILISIIGTIAWQISACSSETDKCVNAIVAASNAKPKAPPDRFEVLAKEYGGKVVDAELTKEEVEASARISCLRASGGK